MSIPTIAVDQIHPHPHNVRRDLGDLTELAASIRAVGLLQPLVVAQSGTGWVVVDGHRRLAAAKLIGAKSLPCLALSSRMASASHVAVMLAAAMHKALGPVEQAAAFQALRDTGMTITEISQRTGYAASTITGRLLLRTLPGDVTEMVVKKEMTVAEATALARELHDKSVAIAERRAPRSTWFTARHCLADVAAAACTPVHHANRSMVGGVACGQCWERAIRDDQDTYHAPVGGV